MFFFFQNIQKILRNTMITDGLKLNVSNFWSISGKAFESLGSNKTNFKKCVVISGKFLGVCQKK